MKKQAGHKFYRAPLLLFLLTMILSGCKSLGDSEPKTSLSSKASQPSRALFIGNNSFTFWRGGLWAHLETLFRSLGPATWL